MNIASNVYWLENISELVGNSRLDILRIQVLQRSTFVQNNSFRIYSGSAPSNFHTSFMFSNDFRACKTPNPAPGFPAPQEPFTEIEKLPGELIDNILDHSERPTRLTEYALTSSKWQRAFETRSFRVTPLTILHRHSQRTAMMGLPVASLFIKSTCR